MKRVELAAAKRVARVVDRVASAARDVHGVRVEIEDARVVISGRALWRRPELRWIGGMLR